MSVYSSIVITTPSTHNFIDRKLYSLPDLWSPVPPRDRRKTESKGECDKRTTMQEAVARHIRDGINLGIGGLHDTRSPVAIVHEIIRRGVKGLTLSLSSSSLSAELLAGAMILDPSHVSISRVQFAWHDNELKEMRPLLGHLVSTGMVECDDCSDCAMGDSFDASSCGSGHKGWQSLEDSGSATALIDREKIATHTFQAEKKKTWSLCRPDVGIVHVPAADMCGNARILGSVCACPDIARTAIRTIMSVDQVLPKENIFSFSDLSEISFEDVDEVVEQPFGATPGACQGHYWFDVPHLLEFRSICKEFTRTGDTQRLQKYYDRNIFGCETFEDFLNLQSSRALREIIRKDGVQPLNLD